MNALINEVTILKPFLMLIVLLTLSGCAAFNAPNQPATMRAENTASVAEATTIAQTFSADQAVIQATAAAAGTSIAGMSSINRQLILTARAVIPPTQVRQVGTAQAGLGGTPAAGGSQFADIGVATSVRQSDGCADSFETQISENAPAIYVNAKALTVSGGTVMGVEWRSNGQVVAQETWTVPRDETNFCIWFNLDPSRIPFTPGLWSVQLSANGNAIQPEVQFSIVETPSVGS